MADPRPTCENHPEVDAIVATEETDGRRLFFCERCAVDLWLDKETQWLPLPVSDAAEWVQRNGPPASAEVER